jgi:hypothetical protein
MGKIYDNECANNTESQNWFVMADGRIALEPSGQSRCLQKYPGTHDLKPLNP